MKKLATLLDEFESRIPFFEKENLAISKSSVGWHIEHSLLTINGITRVLLRSNPKEYQWKFKLSRLFIFILGKIPRGKAKAPEIVVPKTNLDVALLQEHLNKSRNSLMEIESLSNYHYFEHPYLGKLKKKDALRFLEIHTNHHLEIITDITKL